MNRYIIKLIDEEKLVIKANGYDICHEMLCFYVISRTPEGEYGESLKRERQTYKVPVSSILFMYQEKIPEEKGECNGD